MAGQHQHVSQGPGGERWAAIDIGTNSVRLLVADLTGDNLVAVARDLRLTRLGQGVDRHRRLDPQAVERTVAAVGELATRARSLGVAGLVVAGTSALRDAGNRADFCRRVRREYGLDVAVLSGAGEAALSFLGAVRGLPGGHDGRTVWTVDVGGGSTEVVRGTADGRVLARASADVGAVRMTEAFVASDPISPEDWHRLAEAIDQGLTPLWDQLAATGSPPAEGSRTADVDQAAGHGLMGLGGTATTLAALDQRLEPYDPSRVHGYRLRREAVADLLQRMRASTVAQRRAWPGLQPARADIILAGTAIVHAVMVRLGAPELVVSEADLLDGLILWAARQGRDPAHLVDPARGREI